MIKGIDYQVDYTCVTERTKHDLCYTTSHCWSLAKCPDDPSMGVLIAHIQCRYYTFLATVLLRSSLLTFSVSTQQQGDLRFGGSFSDGNSGRLEVFLNNEWGTICIDGFTKRSADTACRQLGSTEALTFGEANRLGYASINYEIFGMYSISGRIWSKLVWVYI